MHQDQRIPDLASLGIHEHRDLDQALRRATSLEIGILGYGVGDYHDQSQDYEDALGRRRIRILDIHAGEDEEAFEDNATIDDYNELKKVNVKADEEVSEKTDEEQVVVQGDCFSIIGQTITVDLGRLGEFSKILTKGTKVKCDLTKLITKIINNKTYFGIEWTDAEDNKATGKLLSSNPLYKLIK